jgi:hypothetical protein
MPLFLRALSLSIYSLYYSYFRILDRRRRRCAYILLLYILLAIYTASYAIRVRLVFLNIISSYNDDSVVSCFVTGKKLRCVVQVDIHVANKIRLVYVNDVPITFQFVWLLAS